MKTTYEKSIEYAEINDDKHCNLSKNFDKFDIAQSFEAGAEFAQRWISVEEELPEYHGIDFYVLMKNERLDSDDINLGLIEGIDDVENVYQYATHWRPIELK